jgi:integrase
MIDENIKAFRIHLTNDRKRPETTKAYVLIAKRFLTLINKDPKDINKDDLEKWKTYCQRYGDNSLTPKYGAIKKYISFLIDQEILPEEFYGVVLRRLKAPKLQVNETNLDELVLTPEQQEQIYNIAKQTNYMHYAMFKTAFYGMLRRCEFIGLNIDDIQWENKKLKLRAEITKGGKPATINLSQDCLDILNDYIVKYRDNPRKGHEKALFLREGRRLSRTMTHEIHKEYKKRTGINIHTHMWRHSGITEYAKYEKDVKKIQTQARHDDPVTTMRYINYANKDYEDSYHKFAEQHMKKPQPLIPIEPPRRTTIETTQSPQLEDIARQLQELQLKVREQEISLKEKDLEIKALRQSNKEGDISYM